MKIRCLLFGHELHSSKYAKTELREVDGIGRQHADLIGECVHCSERFKVCRTIIRQETPHEPR
jgi:hypothetical protein